MDARILTVPLVAAVALAAGCGGAKQSSQPPPTTTAPAATTTPTTTTGGAGALQAEANAAAAGDIPDNQIFLAFHDAAAGYSIKYPEGWAQRGSGSNVTFRDKNNVIRAVTTQGAAWTKPTVAADLQTLKARLQGGPQAITLSGKPAFKVVYRTVSAPNAVTGKRVTLTVDRYYLSKPGRRAVLDLGSPVGVDNVDAYRLISESFRWS
jgi:hypothetical protein